MRVIIADDEELGRERVRQMLQPHHAYTVVAECADGVDTVEAILRERPDIVFLDITMPGLDGLEVADAVAEHSPQIVFVTAHDRFAHRAYDINAVDYLVKPISRDRFEETLARIEARLAAAASSALPAPLLDLLQQLQVEHTYAQRLLVRSARGHYFIAPADVEWVEAEGNYVILHARGERHVVRKTMRNLEQRLDPRRFVRIHRSAIVNLDLVERLEPQGHGEYSVVLKSGARLESSRAYSAALQALLNSG